MDDNSDERAEPDVSDDEAGDEDVAPSSTPWRGVDTESLTERDGQPAGEARQTSDEQPTGEPSPASEPDERKAQSIPPAGGHLPGSTARAVIVATAVGALALSVHQPLLGVGVLTGAAVGRAVTRFTGGFAAITAGAVFLPVVVFGLIAGFGTVAQTPPSAALSTVGLIGGLAVAAIHTDVTSNELQQFGFLALLGSFVVAVVAGVSYSVDLAGGLGTVLWNVAGILPSGFAGLLGWFVLAALAFALAVYLLPPAMLTTPNRPENALRRKSLVGVTVLPAAFVLFVLVPFLTTSGATGLAHVSLVVCTSLFCTLAVVNGLVGQSWGAVGHRIKPLLGWITTDNWQRSGQETNPITGAVAGLHLSAWVVFLFAHGTTGVSQPVPALFGLAAVVLGAGGLVGITYARTRNTSLPGSITVITAALGGGVVIVELLRTGDEPVIGLNLATLGTVVAVGAALFVYSAGQHGQTLAREVGAPGTARQPQLVWLGWHSLVVVVGVLAAVVLFWLSSSLSLVLSDPARAGLGGGLVALVALTALLLRR